MRPSRAKTPAARAAGGIHPGALFSSGHLRPENILIWELSGAGGLLGGRNISTPARGIAARTPARTPARPQPTPSRRAQDGVVSNYDTNLLARNLLK